MTAPAHRARKLQLSQDALALSSMIANMDDTSEAAQSVHARACALADGVGEVSDRLTEEGR